MRRSFAAFSLVFFDCLNLYIFKNLWSYADMPMKCHIDKTKICRVINIFVLTLPSSYLISISPWMCHKENVTLMRWYIFYYWCLLWYLNKDCNIHIFIVFLNLLFTYILQAKAAVYVMVASIIDQNIEIKNQKVICNHDDIDLEEASLCFIQKLAVLSFELQDWI